MMMIKCIHPCIKYLISYVYHVLYHSFSHQNRNYPDLTHWFRLMLKREKGHFHEVLPFIYKSLSSRLFIKRKLVFVMHDDTPLDVSGKHSNVVLVGIQEIQEE